MYYESNMPSHMTANAPIILAAFSLASCNSDDDNEDKFHNACVLLDRFKTPCVIVMKEI